MTTVEQHFAAQDDLRRRINDRIDGLLRDPSDFLDACDCVFSNAFSADKNLSDFWGWSPKRLASKKQERDDAKAAVRALQTCVRDHLSKRPQTGTEFVLGRLYARFVVAAAERECDC